MIGRTRVIDDPLWRAVGLLGLRGRPVAWAILLGVCGALSALGLAALSAWLITRAWQMPPVLYLSVAITAVRALGISRGVFRYLERLATHRLALGAMATARERVYRRLADGAPGYSVTLRRGDLLARTGDDIDEIGNALIRGVIPIAVGAVTGMAAVVIMALVSWWAAVVLAGALVVSAVVAPWLAARGSARTIADAAGASTRVTEATLAALWHGPELTVARRREHVLATASRADADALSAADRGLRHQASAAAATPLAMGMSLLAACLVGIHLASSTPGSLADVASGEGLTPMILGVLILLPLSSFESTAPLTEAGIQLERSRQSAARVLALVDGAGPARYATPDGDPDEDDGSGPLDRPIHRGPVTLVADELRWGHPAGPELGPAEGESFRLPPGGRLVVVGPSGSGKSTLLLTLGGLLEPRHGTVECRDDDDRVDPRSAVCYFSEEGHLFSTTVAENLLVARGDATESEVLDALRVVGLADWVHSLPDGLHTELTGGADAVSGGQRRRLLLARALLHPAPVVLLDEPTEHLDDADAAAILRRILSRDDGWFGPHKTVVVVTHQLVAQDVSSISSSCAVLEVGVGASA
ncbi:thiol reductant ABC exporter subunit CydC [Gordonia sp. CPCC 206044]|uniref:thiol reductant ABC exporter subunit CydC n=1 Tax=Gordonia sp. CPCC 206044 TaxID=3140793 RepID=UPI003AF383B9